MKQGRPKKGTVMYQTTIITSVGGYPEVKSFRSEGDAYEYARKKSRMVGQSYRIKKVKK